MMIRLLSHVATLICLENIKKYLIVDLYLNWFE